MLEKIFQSVKTASTSLSQTNDELRNRVLLAVADAIDHNQESLLAANSRDLALMDPSNPLYDRLSLSPERLTAIANDMRCVSRLPSPLNRILEERTLPNGLLLRKISVPFGVIGMIYEARPNVTFDVFSLCFKSANACVLKGGKDAYESNKAAVSLIHQVLSKMNIDTNVVALLPASHEATTELLHAVGYIDLVIPRGGRRLIDLVRNEAKVPCIETGAGVVDAYFDADGDLEIGSRVINNSKTRRPSVCNALDCLLIHEQRLSDLPTLCAPLTEKGVELYADKQAYEALVNNYPYHLLHHSTPNTYGTEFMSLRMAIRTVRNLSEALTHIARYGSGHSECIITENELRANQFQSQVDAACVYVNAPTSFTDGGEFGLGAEIGISTQKLGARGPMALNEITTYKWLINGRGQIRP